MECSILYIRGVSIDAYHVRWCINCYASSHHLISWYIHLINCYHPAYIYTRVHVETTNAHQAYDMFYRQWHGQLLKCRWSLIAGRLPGRTANDVKNFWNTHVEKKLDVGQKTGSTSHTLNIDVPKTNTPTYNCNVIRPRPRTFTNLLHVTRKIDECNDANNQKKSDHDQGSGSSSQEKADDCVEWWSKLLELTEKGELVKAPLEDALMGEASSSGLSEGTSIFALEEFDWGLLNLDEQV